MRAAWEGLRGAGFTGCGKSPLVCHSERSEESLLDQNKGLRGILRAKSALRMTAFRFFPQPVKPAVPKPRAKPVDRASRLLYRVRSKFEVKQIAALDAGNCDSAI
jgi:hypothetical protein